MQREEMKPEARRFGLRWQSDQRRHRFFEPPDHSRKAVRPDAPHEVLLLLNSARMTTVTIEVLVDRVEMEEFMAFGI